MEEVFRQLRTKVESRKLMPYLEESKHECKVAPLTTIQI
jgi:hypothetical protein